MSSPKPMQSFDMLKVGDYSVSLNGEKAPDELQKIGFDIPLHSFIDLTPQCPFCNSDLLTCGNLDLSDFYDLDVPDGKGYYLWYCRYCRFWQWYYYFDRYAESDEKDEVRSWIGEGCPPAPEQNAYISKLREFNDDLPTCCSSELAQYLRSRPSEWHRYEPKRFEKLVADIFRANYERAEVIHVGKPDDGGVDVIFIDSANQQWLVQVKRRERAGRAEGVNTVRNLIGAMVLEGAMRGIVVSTADHFTFRAQQAAKRLKKQGFYIELIDKGILNRMLEPILPDRPWLKVVKMDDPEIASLLSQKVPSDYQLSFFDLY